MKQEHHSWAINRIVKSIVDRVWNGAIMCTFNYQHSWFPNFQNFPSWNRVVFPDSDVEWYSHFADIESEKKKGEWREIAKRELEDWYKHSAEQFEKTKKNNRYEQQQQEK